MCGFHAVQSENTAVFTEAPASQRINRRALCEESEARVSSPGRGPSWTYGVIRASENGKNVGKRFHDHCVPGTVPSALHNPHVAGEAPEAGEAG